MSLLYMNHLNHFELIETIKITKSTKKQKKIKKKCHKVRVYNNARVHNIDHWFKQCDNCELFQTSTKNEWIKNNCWSSQKTTLIHKTRLFCFSRFAEFRWRKFFCFLNSSRKQARYIEDFHFFSNVSYKFNSKQFDQNKRFEWKDSWLHTMNDQANVESLVKFRKRDEFFRRNEYNVESNTRFQTSHQNRWTNQCLKKYRIF